MKTLRYSLLALTVFASTQLTAMDQPKKSLLLKDTTPSHRTPADIFAYVSTLDENRIKEMFDAEKDRPESIRKMALRLAYAKKFGQELDDSLECVDFVRDYKKYGVSGFSPSKRTKLFSQDYLPYVLPLLELLIGEAVTALYLDDNQLTKLPKSIGNLSKLKVLSLDNNQLTKLPKSIGNLSELQELHLYRNKLTALPESIGNLGNLKELWLDNNKLTMLPKSIGNLSRLNVLNLSNNKLTELPESIGNRSKLSRLYLYGNQLTGLPESIGNLSNLIVLSLYNNQLTDEEKAKVNQLFEGRSIDLRL